MKNSLLNEIKNMTDAQLYTAMYEDCITGALNRRAYENETRNLVAVIDLDSLKYVNDNLGHRAGDSQLRRLAQSLIETFGKHNVFRLSGDEFAVSLDNIGATFTKITALKSKLPIFSVGIGSTLEKADVSLRQDKQSRERSGLRSARGVKPFWFDDICIHI